MAQHDYSIANQSGLAFRQDLNNALSAIVSINSGTAEPSTTYAYQLWADTTTGLIKQRNAANNAWVTIGTLGSTNWGLLSSGSTITAALGSASTPGVTFAGDLDTGLYSPGANQVALSTGGTGRLFINSSGKVGVGTSSPQRIIEAAGTGSDGMRISITGNTGSDFAVLDFYQANAQKGVIYTTTDNFVINASAGPLIFQEGGAEAARIDSSGRLLVGTSSAPTGIGNTQYAKLTVNGNTSGATAGIVAICRGEAATSITADETLGVIAFGDTGAGEYAQITCQADANAGSGDYPGRLVFSTTADGAGSPTERMRIDSAGIVYIRESDGTAGVYHQMDASANYRIGNHSGGSGNYVYLAPGGTSWVGVSDERLKTALVEIQDGLSKVSTLRAVTGRYTDDPETESRSFLIAQDVAAVLPEAVDAANSEQLGLRYTDTIPLLVAALKEAKEKIETLEAKVAALEAS